MSALVEDTGTGTRVLLDLVRGCLAAWMRPSFGAAGAERVAGRRLATVSTVWVCWCVVFVGTPALLRAVEDPPPPGFDPSAGGWRVAHDIITGGLLAGWLLVALVGVPLGLRAMRHRPAVRKMVLGPLLLLVGCGLLFVPIQVYATRHWAGGTPAASQIPVWWAVLGLLWLLGIGADVIWGTLALALAVRHCDLDAARLKRPAMAAALLIVPMWAVTALVLAVTFFGAGPSAAGPMELAVYTVAAALLGCALVASVSAVRGARLSD